MLARAGHEVLTLDISVEPWDPALVERVDAVAFSVPMHTAMRLAVKGAEAVKEQRPELPVACYGLYAGQGASGPFDRTIAGEYEAELAGWLDDLDRAGPVTDLGRRRQLLPVRASLPELGRYARLAVGAEERLAGYVEASHGCAHRCRHCPVPVVYDGRTRRVDVDVVMDDVAQLVDAGARHVTFGDPDFLNRWAHSMQVVSELHERFGDVTYDITTKVEHVLRHADLLPELARTGCLFAVSAFECTSDRILGYLDKGHSALEAGQAVALLRSHGIEPRPSWLPFMPWTTVDDVYDLLDFVVEHGLVGNVDPVQYTIRLLIPEGSLMLEIPEIAPYLGCYDAATLSYDWTAADERTVDLQSRFAALVEEQQGAGVANEDIFCELFDVAAAAASKPPLDRERLRSSRTDVPRLTEPWFCCAEPTTAQFVSIGGTS
jgi:hypothetical protein